MMFVAVRGPAGLLASDCNGSDPMDVHAAERRINVVTRRELAKHPECLALLAYLWAIACACAAYFDRDPSTTPRMRVGWAFNCLVFLRWWLDWIEVTSKSAAVHFISMETHAGYDVMCQELVMLVLLWGRDFATLPFAPWLVGSDQNEHFNNELRSFRLSQPDWTLVDVLRLAARFIHQLVLRTRPGVCLPAVFSKRGFNRAIYEASPTGEHVQTEWLTPADVRNEYHAAVERVRPIFVVLGAAKALRDANRWHRPSLEEWDSIEKAIDAQEAEQVRHEQRERRREADEESEGEEEAESEAEGEEEEEAAEGGDDESHYPECILKDRLKPGRPAAERELLIKWKGWSSDPDDLTWEAQVRLIEDGNAPLILE
eukprot:5438484-Prymnesium_polylepis.1